jgi:hypothetical protein
MSWRVLVVVGASLFSLAVTASSSAAWQRYNNSGNFFPTPSANHASTGYANWTDHRVYRSVTPPVVLHFHLEYCHTDGTCHWSASNAVDNPFYYTPGGYSKLWCYWDYWNDSGYLESYNPACQGYS